MTLPLRLLLAALLVGGLILGFSLLMAGGEAGADSAGPLAETAPGGAAPALQRWHSSTQCRECHADVWDEWHGSHHQISYTNPEVRKLSDDFRNKECQACHLPRPVFETGIGNRPLQRIARPTEGIGCLTCHLSRDGEILGRNDRPDAPCQPRANDDVVAVAMCEVCHNQHWTTDQWRASPFFAQNVGCNDCHMPEVAREGGRRGRHHGFPGAHDVEMLRRAAKFQAFKREDALVLALTNDGCGHSFPTEERSRAVDMVYRFAGADGAPLGEFEQAFRFRMPYRDEPGRDTQLPAGATKAVRVPIPDGATKAVARLWYRLEPYIGDDHPRSTKLFEIEVDLTAEATDAPVIDDSGAPETAAPPAAGGRKTPPPAELVALVESGPTRPDDARMAELNDLLETAFRPAEVGQRLAGRAKRSLLEADDVAWGLEAGLEHEQTALRSQAAFQLGELGKTESIPALLLRLKYERDPLALVWVVDALDKLGNRAGLLHASFAGWLAVGPFTQRPDIYTEVGRIAAEILRRDGRDIGDNPTYAELEAGLRELHADWQRTGTARGGPAPELTPLVRKRVAQHLLNLDSWQLRPVDDARKVLVWLGAAAVPMLVDAIRSDNTYLRNHTLEILRDLGPVARPAYDALIPLLDDRLSERYALQVLGRIGDPRATRHVRRRLDSKSLDVRVAAAEALGLLRAREAAPDLARMFEDEAASLDVRVYAAFALARLGQERGRAFLEGLRESGGYHADTLRELLEKL